MSKPVVQRLCADCKSAAPVPGQRRCVACRDRNREECKYFYRQAREKHKCVRCRGPSEPGYAQCKICRDEVRAAFRAAYKQRVKDGQCIRCGGVRHRGAYCANCAKKMAVHEAARRVQKSAALSENIDLEAVFVRDGWHCQICGCATPAERRGTRHQNAPELDHRIPLSRGGTHTYDNVQCACHRCNLRKGNRSVAGQLPLWSRPAA